MATFLSVNSISHEMGTKELFQDLKLGIGEKARLGIVGPNGSGKSTLMKIMAGIIIPDDGQVVTSSSAHIAYIPQVEDFPEDESIQNVVCSKLKGLFSEVEADVRAQKYLTKVGFTDLQQSVSALSGGWRKRLSIAISLATDPQLLLLDEPTNHLDLAGLVWLENLLANANFAWALISHDRYFLQRTVNEVCEIAPHYENGIFKSEGSYTDFVRKRAEFWEQQSAELASLRNKHRNEKDWMSRGPKARGTKAVARIKEFEKIEEELQLRHSRAQKETVKTSFTASGRQTKELIELIKVSFGYDDKLLLEKQSLTLKSRMRLGVLGTNGQGKSTFLKLISGEIQPQSGKIKFAQSLQVCYFDQLRKQLDDCTNLKDILTNGDDQIVYRGKAVHIISWAKRFGFERDDLAKSVSSLSGGEQARALLSVLVRQEADVLILDEPTNDLDIPMLEALEAMLIEFPGALVLVTHDRFMLERVCNKFLGYTTERVLQEFSSYDQWESSRVESKKNRKEKKTKQPRVKDTSKRKMSQDERKELSKMERRIEKAEQQLEALKAHAASEAVYTNAEASLQVSADLKAAAAEIEALYARWEELEQLR